MCRRSDEIEITPEMVEAGAAVLLESGYLRYEFSGGVRLLIQNILSACLSLPNRGGTAEGDAQRA